MPKQFDDMRLRIKKQLISDGKSEEEAEKSSFAIATAQWKKSHNGKGPTEYTDKDGHFVVGENVKVIIDAQISAGEVFDE